MLNGKEEKKIWKYIAVFMIALAAVTLIVEGVRTGIQLAWIISAAEAEGEEYKDLYVTADVLNGRAWPTKKASIEAIFDYGDKLKPTGRWSKNFEWVEVEAGESGTVWVHYKYVSERVLPFEVKNESNGKIKIRNKPGGKGKVRGYIKNGKTVEIDRAVLGWGHCSKGWVDLDYFSEGE